MRCYCATVKEKEACGLLWVWTGKINKFEDVYTICMLQYHFIDCFFLYLFVQFSAF